MVDLVQLDGGYQTISLKIQNAYLYFVFKERLKVKKA